MRPSERECGRCSYACRHKTTQRIILRVGAEQELFSAHSGLLKFHTKKFGRLVQDPVQDEITLATVKLATFESWLGWMYKFGPSPFANKTLEQLVQAYFLGSDLQSYDFQNDAMDAIRKYYSTIGSWPTPARMQQIFRNTKEGSPMRAFMIDVIWFHHSCCIDIAQYFEGEVLNGEFVREWLHRLIRDEHLVTPSVDSDPRMGFGCRYHIHP